MSNLEKYINVFKESLMVEKEKITRELKYQSIPEWDSVGHMGLLAGMEEAFDISLNSEDMIDFRSFEKGIAILKKYGVEVEGGSCS